LVKLNLSRDPERVCPPRLSESNRGYKVLVSLLMLIVLSHVDVSLFEVSVVLRLRRELPLCDLFVPEGVLA
jgi:hypothetical protein